MNSRFRRASSMILVLNLICWGTVGALAADRVSPQRAIKTAISQYVDSIDSADLQLAAKIWLTSPQSSFIHPRGHEVGWKQISENFYGTTMGATFTKRHLELTSAPRINVHGKSAVAEFDWDFVATRRDNGAQLHTTGRESQVWVNTPGKGWRLVHVHYSGPPQTGIGEGF